MHRRAAANLAGSSHQRTAHSTTTTHSSQPSLPTGAEPMYSESDESDTESTGHTSHSAEFQELQEEDDDDTPAPSIFSFRSSRDGLNLLRESEGRLFNAQNELYALPADDTEFDRLDKQHLAQLLIVGGLYLPKELVESILAPREGVERAILDLGSGSGSWAIEMANAFPHAQVVGIDLAPTTTKELPPNCRFEFDDFTLGLPHYHHCFDVVHARFIANGVTSFTAIIEEMAQCLRPGGIALLVEADFELLNEHLEPLNAAQDDDDSPNTSWLSRFFMETYETLKQRGSDIDGSRNIGTLIRDCTLLENCGKQTLYTNVGPWLRGTWSQNPHETLVIRRRILEGSNPTEQERYDRIGELLRSDLLELGDSFKPLLLSEGYFPDVVNQILDNMKKELNDSNFHSYIQWHFAWGTRRIETTTGLDEESLEYSSGESSPASGSAGLPPETNDDEGLSTPFSGMSIDDQSQYS
ncbi:hypothetical protein FRC03_010315 [Tulasnella sp. 419]|nr:hypothetical protein FRC03_010315 [Tulasnella sp. 419]